MTINRTVFENKTKISETFVESLLKRFIEKKLNKLSVEYSEDKTVTVIFAHDFVGSQINIYGFFERDDLNDLFLFLAPAMQQIQDGVALDIGANIGNHSIYFSNMFKGVFAYEPNPSVFSILDFNCRNFPNITVNNHALGELTQNAELIQVKGNIGASSIEENPEKHQGGIPIAVKTADSVLDDVAEKITFLKIDVEGHELKVLKGAQRTIHKHQPIIAFEQHQDEFVNGSTPSIDFLRALGYSICWSEYPRERTNSSLIREYQKLIDKILRRRPKIITGTDIKKKSHSMMVGIPKHLVEVLEI